jgi:chemotaxis protein MotB
MQGSGQNFVVSKDNMSELKEQLQKAIREVPNIEKLTNHIDMTVTNEGLRIELMESANGTFFESGRAKPNGDGDDILITLAHELGKLPNKMYVEGHTDAKAYSKNSNYKNWEQSADRANDTRRLIQQKA